MKVSSASAIRLVVSNLVLGREPLYGLGEWAARYDPALLGLTVEDAGVLNDDRVGRALEALFDADRASLLTAVVLRAISEFHVDTDQLHNDSTSISVHGAYRDAVGTPRGGQATPVITFGHSKDHRPDLKQLVWILTVSADGAVPLAYRLADGNTVDDPTHVPTWDGLVGLLGRTDFLYVADSKLCSRAAMGHLDSRGGRFVTVMPRSRAEDGAFRDHLQTHAPVWIEAIRLPGVRQGDPDGSTPPPLRHCHRRRATGSCGCTPPTRPATTPGPGRPDQRRRRRDQSFRGQARWPTKPVQDPRRGRTGRRHRSPTPAPTGGHRHRDRDDQQDVQASTRWPSRARYQLPRSHHHSLHPRPRNPARHDPLRRRQRRLPPLMSNDRLLSDTQVLAAYRYQPNLERRHHLLKSVQDAAPVLLHNRPGSKHCSAASPWPCSSARSSNTRSAPACTRPISTRSGSTRSSATAPRPPPHGYWKCSPPSAATADTTASR